MAVGDMPQFVRDHALHLVRGRRLAQQARMDIDGLTARDEGVDRIVVDEDDADVARRQAGGLDQRRRHLRKHRLGLGVAQDRLRGDGLGHGQEGERERGDQSLHEAAIVLPRGRRQRIARTRRADGYADAVGRRGMNTR